MTHTPNNFADVLGIPCSSQDAIELLIDRDEILYLAGVISNGA